MRKDILEMLSQYPDDEREIFIDSFIGACGDILKKYPEIQKKVKEIKKKRREKNGKSY